jgi:hypothetical protein
MRDSDQKINAINNTGEQLITMTKDEFKDEVIKAVLEAWATITRELGAFFQNLSHKFFGFINGN